MVDRLYPNVHINRVINYFIFKTTKEILRSLLTFNRCFIIWWKWTAGSDMQHIFTFNSGEGWNIYFITCTFVANCDGYNIVKRVCFFWIHFYGLDKYFKEKIGLLYFTMYQFWPLRVSSPFLWLLGGLTI